MAEPLLPFPPGEPSTSVPTEAPSTPFDTIEDKTTLLSELQADANASTVPDVPELDPIAPVANPDPYTQTPVNDPHTLDYRFQQDFDFKDRRDASLKQMGLIGAEVTKEAFYMGAGGAVAEGLGLGPDALSTSTSIQEDIESGEYIHAAIKSLGVVGDTALIGSAYLATTGAGVPAAAAMFGVGAAVKFTSRVINKIADKPRVSVAQIQQLANAKDVPAQEKNAINRALSTLGVDQGANGLKAGDSIDTEQLRMAFDDEILPLKTELSGSYASYDVSNEIVPSEYSGSYEDFYSGAGQPVTKIYQSPGLEDNVQSSNHFSDPNYIAHVRSADFPKKSDMGKGGADKGVGYREVYELQSDLFQKEVKNDMAAVINANKEKVYQNAEQLNSALMDYTNRTGDKSMLSSASRLWNLKAGVKYSIDSERDLMGSYVSLADDISSADKFLRANDPMYVSTVSLDMYSPELDPRLLDQQKQWYKRVVREELNSANEAGLDYVDFPTGDTAARIEGWYKPRGEGATDEQLSRAMDARRQLVGARENHDLYTDDEYNQIELEQMDYLNSIFRHPQGDNAAMDVNHMLTLDEAEFEAVTQDWLIWDNYLAARGGEAFGTPNVTKELYPQHEGLFKFYEKDLNKFLGKNYTMKRIVKDSQTADNAQPTSWWRVTIPKHTKEIMIPSVAVGAVGVGAAARTQTQDDQL